MTYFFSDLLRRNAFLFWFGGVLILMSFFCFGLSLSVHEQIQGENLWAKPTRYYLSFGISIWSMAWLMDYLQSKVAKRVSTFFLFTTVLAETTIVMLQSARGVPSHFNNTDPFNTLMHSTILLSSLLYSMVVFYLCFLFFTQKKMPISQHYTWGIRMGILLFLIFSLSGGYMFHIMKHSVGGPDGGAGLPMFNWSTKYGDLRVAHFLGIHSLQIIPLVSYYFLQKKNQVIRFSILYAVLVITMFILALAGIPIINFGLKT